MKGKDTAQMRSFHYCIEQAKTAAQKFIEGDFFNAVLTHTMPLASDLAQVDRDWLQQRRDTASSKRFTVDEVQWQKNQSTKLYAAASPLLYILSLGFSFAQRVKDTAHFHFGRSGFGCPTAQRLQASRRFDEIMNGVQGENEPAPLCSLYGTTRQDFTAYVLSIDIDVENTGGYKDKHKFSREECRTNFECKQRGHLKTIAEVVKETFAEIHDQHPTPFIGWHRSKGQKVSYRGYLIGPVFGSMLAAKEIMTYVTQNLMSNQGSWYCDGIVDLCEYGNSRIIRLLGNAKLSLNAGNLDNNMRPLLLQPIAVSDLEALAMYEKSPNYYIGRCVGIFCSKEHLDGSLKAIRASCEIDSGMKCWDGVPQLNAVLKRSVSRQTALSGSRVTSIISLKRKRGATDDQWQSVETANGETKQIFHAVEEKIAEFSDRAADWKANEFYEDDFVLKVRADHGFCVTKHRPARNHTKEFYKTWFEYNKRSKSLQNCCFKCGFIGRSAKLLGYIDITPQNKKAVDLQTNYLFEFPDLNVDEFL